MIKPYQIKEGMGKVNLIVIDISIWTNSVADPEISITGMANPTWLG